MVEVVVTTGAINSDVIKTFFSRPRSRP